MSDAKLDYEIHERAIRWRNGKLESASIGSTLGGPCVVRYGEKRATIPTAAGKTYRLEGSPRWV